ncbi:SDR family oxidoreductase [Terriglobus saanensis]|nr:SDR family oxidoreductase [Terriglobus saanensis]
MRYPRHMPIPQKTPKVALITGASSGIGLLATLTLARNGYTVIATMRDLARATHLREKAEAEGLADRIDLHALDVTDSAQVTEAANYVKATHGRLDVLVNNAGYALAGFSEETTLAELRHQFETNFFGAVQTTTAMLPLMRAQTRQTGGAKILMISSISGLTAFPLLGSYNASKFALEGWSEALSMELRSLGIHVSLVEPGAFDTDIWSRNATITSATQSPGSPNYKRSQAFLAQIGNGKMSKADPQQIADLILRIAQSPNPKLRYLIGKDARSAKLLRTLLPMRLFQSILLKASGIDS